MQNDPEAQTLIDNALVEQEMMSVTPGVIQAMIYSQSQTNTSTFHCDSIQLISGDTNDFIPNPVYKLMLSGTGCSDFFKDQKIRSGQIMISTTGKINAPGTQVVLKLSNYFADELSYTCDSVLIHILDTNASQMKLSLEIANAQCSGSGFTIKYQANKIVRLNKLNATAGPNSTFSVSGEASGTNRFQIHYKTRIDTTESLNMFYNCRYFVKGIQEITNEGKSPLQANYGNGNCDEVGTYNIFENTVEFKLK